MLPCGWLTFPGRGTKMLPGKMRDPALVIIDGDVVFKGDFSIHKIVQEVADRYRR